MNFISVNSKTKELERHFMQSFQCFCEDFPIGEWIEGETPDFIIITPEGKKIGIEVTQVFKQDGADTSAEQPNETTKEFITEAAKAHAERLGLPPAHVSLFFNTQHLTLLRQKGKPERRFLTNEEKQTVAQRIAEFVDKNMPSEGSSINLEYRLGSGQPKQPIKLSSADISPQLSIGGLTRNIMGFSATLLGDWKEPFPQKFESTMCASQNVMNAGCSLSLSHFERPPTSIQTSKLSHIIIARHSTKCIF